MNAKRSFTLAGHRTSVALEAEFWQALEEIAADRGLSLAALIGDIDQKRSSANLASACRTTVLQFYRDRSHSNQNSSGPG